MTNEEWRKHQCYQWDPLQDIQPALLNSCDIKRYIDEGCLIEKSDFDIDRLKTASYEMRFLGELHYWNSKNDGQLEKQSLSIHNGDSITLPRNSITYLWIKERFLLPEYIAARFNLHIRHVQKGILLGTGPLVDPGFFGSLLIPLHNLTNNDYVVEGGDGIIWVEFTKLSTNKFWSGEVEERPSCLKKFPESKDLDKSERYFRKSGVTGSGGVQSAFKGALDAARKAATDAEKSATDARNTVIRMTGIITFAGILAGMGVLAGLLSLYSDSKSLLFQAQSFTKQILDSEKIEYIQKFDLIALDQRKQFMDIEANLEQIDALKEQIDSYEREIDELRQIMKSIDERQRLEDRLDQ